MTVFTPVPPDLYRKAERAAGELLSALTGRYRRHRPQPEWQPNWRYLLSGGASVTAVVAGLFCGRAEVPEHAWEVVLFRYCPKAFDMLTAAAATFGQWNTGQLDAVLTAEIAAQANRELGGFAVFAVLDVPAAAAEVIATLGAVPTFAEPARPTRM